MAKISPFSCRKRNFDNTSCRMFNTREVINTGLQVEYNKHTFFTAL